MQRLQRALLLVLLVVVHLIELFAASRAVCKKPKQIDRKAMKHELGVLLAGFLALLKQLLEEVKALLLQLLNFLLAHTPFAHLLLLPHGDALSEMGVIGHIRQGLFPCALGARTLNHLDFGQTGW